MKTEDVMSKILVIDDEKSIRSSLREILEYEKYEVDEAADGMEGLKMIKAGGFDAVLCDIKMPKMDGTEVLDKIIADGEDFPVIMISSKIPSLRVILKGSPFLFGVIMPCTFARK